MEKSPSLVHDALHSLGVRTFEPRHARPNFRQDEILAAWYKEVEDASKKLFNAHGSTESEERDLAARRKAKDILASHGSRIWCENPECPRLVAGENDYFLHELLYPRDQERLLEKHMQLFRTKWSSWKSKAHSAAKPAWQKTEDDDDTDSLNSDDDETLNAVEKSERTRGNKRKRPPSPSIDSHDQDNIDVQPLNKKAGRRWNVCLLCRKQDLRCDGGIPSCRNCQTLGRTCERVPRRTSRSSNSTPKDDGSLASQDHEKVYHFSCSVCRNVFAATNLEAHGNSGHDSWDLLPLAGGIYQNLSQRPFHDQGYWLSTDGALRLRAFESRSILQVREQVDGTILVANVEGSRRVEFVNFQQCYSFEVLAFRIARALDVDSQKIERLEVALRYDLDHDVEPGDCHAIAANEENTFREFISMLEGASRCAGGEPRMLLFPCKVVLRQA